MNFKKAVETINKNNCRISEMEDWLGEFIEGLAGNFEAVFLVTWYQERALGKALGLMQREDDESPAELAMIKFYDDTYKEGDVQHKEYLQREFKSVKKINFFFEQFDI